jgi:hypothetical protein
MEPLIVRIHITQSICRYCLRMDRPVRDKSVKITGDSRRQMPHFYATAKFDTKVPPPSSTKIPRLFECSHICVVGCVIGP